MIRKKYKSKANFNSFHQFIFSGEVKSEMKQIFLVLSIAVAGCFAGNFANIEPSIVGGTEGIFSIHLRKALKLFFKLCLKLLPINIHS
jgi:hypothetical protein